LQRRSEKRVDSSRVFSLIEKNIALMKHIDKEKKMPLNIEQYQALQDSNARQLKAIDEIDQMEHPLRIANLKVDLSDIHHDSIRSKRNRELLQAYATDPYLNETVNVMNDMISKSTLQEHKLTKSTSATP
jgi:carboxyl-terminal processing protease